MEQMALGIGGTAGNYTSTFKDCTESYFSDDQPLTAEKRKELILEYTPLINFIAKKFSMRLPPHISRDELVSSGTLGLIDAVEKFDPSKNIRFKTYAEFRIRGAILDELRSLDWVPRSVRKKSSNLARTRQALEKEMGRPPEDEEIAEALGLTMKEFHKLVNETRNLTFFDIDTIRRRLPDSKEEMIFDLIADDDDADPFVQINNAEVKNVLIEAITDLSRKEQIIVSLYYYEELTMKEIAEIMGYTESRISQLHSKAMKKLRTRLAAIEQEITL